MAQAVAQSMHLIDEVLEIPQAMFDGLILFIAGCKRMLSGAK